MKESWWFSKDAIPREIFVYTGREFIRGFVKYMTDLGFTPGMEVM